MTGVQTCALPISLDVSIDKKNLILGRGENATLSLTVTPREDLKEPITLTTATTAGLNDVVVKSENQEVNATSQPVSVSFNVSADKFALPGTYKILVGAQDQEVTISEYVTITIK